MIVYYNDVALCQNVAFNPKKIQNSLIFCLAMQLMDQLFILLKNNYYLCRHKSTYIYLTMPGWRNR